LSWHSNEGKIILLLILLMIGIMLDLSIGPAAVSLSRIFSVLLGAGTATDNVIMLHLRLPIALNAVFIGAALGLAGAVMQTVLDNPLASPFTMGLAGAAGLGASAAIAFGGALVVPFAASAIMPMSAFVSTLLAVFTILAISRWCGMSREVMVLCGISIMFLCQSIQSMVQFSVSPEALTQIVHWLLGDLQKGTWISACIVAVVFVIGLVFLLQDSWQLMALRLGEVRALALGINVERLRKRSLLIVAALTAAAVCFVGTVGFVGLVAPHLARSLMGEDHRWFLPASALAGALLMVFASIASKIIVPGVALPVTIVTALVGVPFLFLLIFKAGRQGV
jgi:iron complex transport system permease protein